MRMACYLTRHLPKFEAFVATLNHGGFIMSLATISIVGNLVRAPEQMFFASGRTKTTLVVAVNGPKSQKTEESTADFYKVETWGKLADLATNYLQKGNQVTVCGRLTFDHWTDKQGRQRVTPVVEANQLALPPRPRLEIVQNTDANPGTLSGEVDISDASANPLASSTYLSDDDFAQIAKETSSEVNPRSAAALEKSNPRKKTVQTA